MSKGKEFLKSFKSFISRGNVVDMAVGVVIGASFGKIVTGLVNFIINPFIGLFIKAGSLDSIKTVIKPAVIEDGVVTVAESAIMWGSWLQTIIDFLIIALCIFIVLRIITKSKSVLDAKGIAEEKAKAEAAKLEREQAEAAAKQRQEAVMNSIIAQEKVLCEIQALLEKK